VIAHLPSAGRPRPGDKGLQIERLFRCRKVGRPLVWASSEADIDRRRRVWRPPKGTMRCSSPGAGDDYPGPPSRSRRCTKKAGKEPLDLMDKNTVYYNRGPPAKPPFHVEGIRKRAERRTAARRPTGTDNQERSLETDPLNFTPSGGLVPAARDHGRRPNPRRRRPGCRSFRVKGRQIRQGKTELVSAPYPRRSWNTR